MKLLLSQEGRIITYESILKKHVKQTEKKTTVERKKTEEAATHEEEKKRKDGHIQIWENIGGGFPCLLVVSILLSWLVARLVDWLIGCFLCRLFASVV